MENPTPISGLNGQPSFHFMYNNKEYFIYFWIDAKDHELQKACLAVPQPRDGGYTANNVLTEGVSEARIQNDGGTGGYMTNRFLPKVNAYLESIGGDSDTDFPLDKTHLEQFNWIIKNALSYYDGVVSISSL